MKKQINPTIKAHLIRGVFYLLLLLAVCAIPFALAQRDTNKRSAAGVRGLLLGSGMTLGYAPDGWKPTLAGNIVNYTFGNSQAAPTCTPIVEMGSIDKGDPTLSNVLRLEGIPQTCPASTSCRIFLGGHRHYDSYTFENTSGETQCVTIDTNTPCNGYDSIFTAAYLGSFDPHSLCTNWIGDSGHAPNPDQAFQVNVDNGQTLVVVVSEVYPFNFGCRSYTVTVTGLCGGGTPSPTTTPIATATATTTATGTPTATATAMETPRPIPTPRPRPTAWPRPTT